MKISRQQEIHTNNLSEAQLFKLHGIYAFCVHTSTPHIVKWLPLLPVSHSWHPFSIFTSSNMDMLQLLIRSKITFQSPMFTSYSVPSWKESLQEWKLLIPTGRRLLVSWALITRLDGLQWVAKFVQQSKSAISCAVQGCPYEFRHRGTRSTLRMLALFKRAAKVVPILCRILVQKADACSTQSLRPLWSAGTHYFPRKNVPFSAMSPCSE